jgi:CRISPR/Cas system-associated endonuclease/helicase Cas3
MFMIVFCLKQSIQNVHDRVLSQTKNTECVMIVFHLKQRIQNVYDRVSSETKNT